MIRLARDKFGIHSLILARATYSNRIRKANLNFCEVNKNTCSGNMGISRIDMPVVKDLDEIIELMEEGMLDINNIPSEAEEDYLESGFGLKKNKVKAIDKKISVKDLVATQDELWLGKAIDMAISGKGLDKPIIVSKDGYIMDGHHRWVAYLLLGAYNRKQLEKIYKIVKKDNMEEVKGLFDDYNVSKDMKIDCVEFQLGGDRLLKVLNAYTDAKGIERNI